MGLDPSYCANSQSPATGELVRSRFESGFCDTYFNESETITTFVIGCPMIAAFLINAALVFIRARRPSLAPKNEEFTMSMVSPLDQDVGFLRPEQQAARRVDQLDSLGTIGRVLQLFMPWLRAPRSSLARQASRVMFVAFNLAVLIPIIMRLVRNYFADWEETTFLGTYNKCSSLCESAGGTSCSPKIPALFVCADISSNSYLLDFLDCLSSGRVVPLVLSGFAVQLILLVLPLHSLVVCVLKWPRSDNSILLALYNLQQLSPDSHRLCCAAATKFALLLVLSLTLFSILLRLPLVWQQTKCENPAYLSCKVVRTGMIIPEMLMNFIFTSLQCLAPVAMSILYAFSAFIVRVRMRAFVSIFHFVAESASALPPNSSDSTRGGQDVLLALHMCRCPHHVLMKARPLLINAGQEGQKSAAAVLKPQLQMLWTMQLREAQQLTNFCEKWLLFQAVVVLIILIPLAAFCSIASLYPFLVPNVTPLLFSFVLYATPFIAAILAMAIGTFYLQRACSQLSLLLLRCGESAETSDDAAAHVFVGQDSLASIVTFCRFTSQDAFCLFGVQIDWMSLARFLYYMGLLVWVVSTSLLPNGIFRRSEGSLFAL